MRDDIFEQLLGVEPSLLLTHGDPESLREAQRERALVAYVTRFGRGKWRGLNLPALQIRRFAHLSLANTIRAQWAEGIENPEVRELLLQIIAAGRLRLCGDLAHSAASKEGSPDGERFEAMLALAALGDARLAALMASLTGQVGRWSERLARWASTSLFPEHMTDEQLLLILQRLAKSPERIDDDAGMARVIELAEISAIRLRHLLPGFAALTREGIEAEDEDLVQRKHRFDVASILRALCARLLRSGVFDSELARATALSLRVVKSPDYLRAKHDARELLAQMPAEVRRQVFEADLALLDQMKPGRDVRWRFGMAAFQGPLELNAAQDAGWVRAALADRSASLQLRSVMLYAALNLADRDATGIRHPGILSEAVDDSLELAQLLANSLQVPKPDPELQRMEKEHQQREKRQRKREEKHLADWMVFWNDVATDPATAFAPGRLDSTVWNLWNVMRKGDRSVRDGRWSRRFLEAHFESHVVDLMRQALMAYWRSKKPSLRSERESSEKNTYLVVWSIGLMGVDAEAQDADWAAKLTDEEAGLASRYALLASNGLPAWLADLAANHPQAVDRVVGREIEHELSEPLGDGRWHSMLLQSLRHANSAAAGLFVPRLASWLSGPGQNLLALPHSASAENRLRQVVQVLLAHGDAAVRAQVRSLASNQLAADEAGPYAEFWLPVLCELDPSHGVATLLRQAEKLPVEKSGKAVLLIGSLFSRHASESGIDLAHPELSADLLLRLTLMVHRHVVFEDDANHEGVYSPGPRDRAEDGRRLVLNAFLRAPGPEALKAKVELSRHLSFTSLEDRIIHLARERQAEEIDCTAAETADVARLFQAKELPPRTGADMAQLLMDRLDDLQDLMRRDTGPRAAWARVDDENALRPAIARELELAARGAYTVDQEAVTAEGKETDIRLRSTSGYQATVELKLGEKARSGKDLRDTIDEQLVDKYMAHSQARTGVLLVTVADPNKRWRHPDTGARIDRFELQNMLSAGAQVAQNRLGGDACVLARVLDLTPRLPPEREGDGNVIGKPSSQSATVKQDRRTE